jgi:hypothetical protein
VLVVSLGAGVSNGGDWRRVVVVLAVVRRVVAGETDRRFVGTVVDVDVVVVEDAVVVEDVVVVTAGDSSCELTTTVTPTPAANATKRARAHLSGRIEEEP